MARFINFIFEIIITLIISIINLDILIKLIVFYIIQVNNPFLLYFIDINKLKAFFINYINKIV